MERMRLSAGPASARRAVRYADSRGVSIAYRVVGDGPHDLVLTPGFVSHLEVLWDEPCAAAFLDRLASFARVVLWDKREQGLSDRTGRAPTLEQSEEDLLAVMAAAGVERASILGVSEGGPMSVLFAARHPERVASLALYGTHARLLRAPGYPEGLRRAMVERALDGMIERWGEPAGLELFAPSRVDDPAFAEWWGRLLRSGTSRGAARAVLGLNLRCDVRALLPAVQAPTLVAHTVDDRVVPLRLGRHLCRHIPDARLVELPGADHLPFAGSAAEPLLEALEEHVTGERPAIDPERILATVLFTDMVGSTSRAARHGDRRWRMTLESYYDLVAAQVARFRGRTVSSAGDGTLAAFDGTARAVRCAAAIVGEAGLRGMPVRAGVHTGEVEVLGDDLAGLAVHIGARISARAGAGEVLVSSTVRDLVVGSDLAFAPRGHAQLAGVPGSWSLFALA